MVSPAKGGDELVGIGPALERERGQLQAYDPAFGAGLQHLDLLPRQFQAHRGVQKGDRLVSRKAQVFGP